MKIKPTKKKTKPKSRKAVDQADEALDAIKQEKRMKTTTPKWIKWKATADSVCPVDEGTIVEVRFNGAMKLVLNPKPAGSFLWENLGIYGRTITAYRIIKKAPEKLKISVSEEFKERMYKKRLIDGENKYIPGIIKITEYMDGQRQEVTPQADAKVYHVGKDVISKESFDYINGRYESGLRDGCSQGFLYGVFIMALACFLIFLAVAHGWFDALETLLGGG